MKKKIGLWVGIPLAVLVALWLALILIPVPEPTMRRWALEGNQWAVEQMIKRSGERRDDEELTFWMERLKKPQSREEIEGWPWWDKDSRDIMLKAWDTMHDISPTMEEQR